MSVPGERGWNLDTRPLTPDSTLPTTWATCTLAEARGQQLVALWAVAGEAARLIDAAVLAEVTRVAALINICGRRGRRALDQGNSLNSTP